MAEVVGDYVPRESEVFIINSDSGIKKAALLSEKPLCFVAGAGLEPTTFGL